MSFIISKSFTSCGSGDYNKEETEISERTGKLLKRKGEKTETGHLLIQDIERLVGEVGIIAGSHI